MNDKRPPCDCHPGTGYHPDHVCPRHGRRRTGPNPWVEFPDAPDTGDGDVAAALDEIKAQRARLDELERRLTSR